MTVVDWNKAPEGATHYDPSDDGMNMPWVKLSKERFYCWKDKVGWIGPLNPNDDFFSDGNVDRLIPRPTKPAAPEWNGEGFPPVGCECSLTLGFVEYPRVKITYMGDGVFCYLNIRTKMEYTGATGDASFRPIRTQAERDRDSLADLCRAKFNQHTSSTNSHLWAQIADAVMAAGWRKGDS